MVMYKYNMKSSKARVYIVTSNTKMNRIIIQFNNKKDNIIIRVDISLKQIHK